MWENFHNPVFSHWSHFSHWSPSIQNESLVWPFTLVRRPLVQGLTKVNKYPHLWKLKNWTGWYWTVSLHYSRVWQRTIFFGGTSTWDNRFLSYWLVVWWCGCPWCMPRGRRSSDLAGDGILGWRALHKMKAAINPNPVYSQQKPCMYGKK